MTEYSSDINPTAVAVIGMAGRFPGAPSVDALWEVLRDGQDAGRWLSDQELRQSGIPPELIAHPDYVKVNRQMADIEAFDAPFFGVSRREAEIMDPQHRVLLECAWNALEDAGYDPTAYAGRIGIMAGAAFNTYMLHNLYPNQHLVERLGFFQSLLGNDKDFLCTRIAHALNLRGPALTVQTACSTSLVAVAMACQSLIAYQSDVMLAGGVAIRVPQNSGYLYQEGGIMSPS
jgi:acyl transferase domain-containing protein